MSDDRYRLGPVQLRVGQERTALQLARFAEATRTAADAALRDGWPELAEALYAVERAYRHAVNVARSQHPQDGGEP